MNNIISEREQAARFSAAVDALGGNRQCATLLGCGERTIRALRSGEKPMHSGWLRDIAAALVAHARHCTALERQLSPLYLENRTAAQRQEGPDERRGRPALCDPARQREATS